LKRLLLTRCTDLPYRAFPDRFLTLRDHQSTVNRERVLWLSTALPMG
jgi:hypothetical protein